MPRLRYVRRLAVILLLLLLAVMDTMDYLHCADMSSPTVSTPSSWFVVRLPAAHAKEIEATHEWTRIGENDTVAAGMHIRIDMTTGEKWVKLNDDAEDPPAAIQATTSLSTQLQVQEVNPMGETHTVEVPIATATSSTADTSEAVYDYDMMHRTLSKLPDDEIARMQLPAKPPSIDTLSPEARQIFEQRMKQIWEDRQEQLRTLELADLPSLLTDRIRALRDYLADPATHLLELWDDAQSISAAETREDDSDTSIRTILDVIADLEYHVQDVDMARDFHTLGGWSLLVSLLYDDVHYTTIVLARTLSHTNQTSTATASTEQSHVSDAAIRTLVHRVQTRAAWALGTAVKNTGEFAPYVLEHITVSGKVSKVSALDLVVGQLQASHLEQRQQTDDTVIELKVLRLVYCLGSFLRGNRAAQVHFGALNGPAWVANATLAILGDDTPSKLTCRLLNLATDTVLDRTRNDDHTSHDSVNNAVVDAWTSPEWCATVQRAVLKRKIEPCAVTALATLAQSCISTWSANDIQAMVESMQKHKTELDTELVDERLPTIESILDQLQT